MIGNWNRIVFYFVILLTVLFYAISMSNLIPDKKEIFMGWLVFISLGVYLFSLAMSIMKEIPENKGFMVFQLVFILVLTLNTIIYLGATGFFESDEEATLELIGMLQF